MHASPRRQRAVVSVVFWLAVDGTVCSYGSATVLGRPRKRTLRTTHVSCNVITLMPGMRRSSSRIEWPHAGRIGRLNVRSTSHVNDGLRSGYCLLRFGVCPQRFASSQPLILHRGSHRIGAHSGNYINKCPADRVWLEPYRTRANRRLSRICNDSRTAHRRIDGSIDATLTTLLRSTAA
jgi:hypothetical protein